VSTYNEAFKAKMVQRMSGPGAMTATALGGETGVAQATLSRWLLAAGSLGGVKKSSSCGAKPRTVQDKVRLVLEASRLSGEERGAFLRREGVHEAELAQWQEAVTEALQGAPSGAARRERAADKRQLKTLRRELARKDKALAEAAALLVLQKKVREIWGADEDDDTDAGSEK
jgi:transposase